MWRPKSWKQPDGIGNKTPEMAYEAGADAMLGALQEKSSLMTPEQMKLIAPDRQYPYGWLVFIPEMEG